MDHDIQVMLFVVNQVYKTAHGKYVKVLEINRRAGPDYIKVQFINAFMKPISNPSEMFITTIMTDYMQYESILLPVNDNVSSLDKVGLDISEQPDSGIRLLEPCENRQHEKETHSNSEPNDLVVQLICDYHHYKSRINYIEHIAKKFGIDLEDKDVFTD